MSNLLHLIRFGHWPDWSEWTQFAVTYNQRTCNKCGWRVIT